MFDIPLEFGQIKLNLRRLAGARIVKIRHIFLWGSFSAHRAYDTVPDSDAEHDDGKK